MNQLTPQELAQANMNYWLINKHCKIEGCTKPGTKKPNGTLVYSKGLCGMHYQRLWKHGTVSPNVSPVDGRTRHPNYINYTGMFKRCYSKHYNGSSNYKNKSIKVCESWSGPHGFNNFVKDMGIKPSSKHTLDRINNDGDYKPGNCRWATPLIQANNKGLLKSNKSGIPGVCYEKWVGKWSAQKFYDGKRVFRKYFDTKQEAIEAINSFKKEFIYDK